MSKNVSRWYKEKGYSFSPKEVIAVKAEDLTIGSHQKVDVLCDYCGKVIQVAWKDYYSNNIGNNKYACNTCRQTQTSEKSLFARQGKIYNELLNFANQFGYELVTQKHEIKNSRSLVTYKCPIHGNHTTTASVLIYKDKHGCPQCQYDKARLDYDAVQSIFNSKGLSLLNPNDYKDYRTKNMIVVCNSCGNSFPTSLNSVVSVNEQLCPVCSKSESQGERKIRLFLEKYKIRFVKEKTFSDCKDKHTLPFDFYLIDLNTIVEYDGVQHFIPSTFSSNMACEQHFEYTKKHDKIKTRYCSDNNITLIRIPYWEFDNIENILIKELNLHNDIV